MKTVIRIKFVVLFTVLLWSAAFLLHSDYFQDSLYKYILWIEWPIFSLACSYHWSTIPFPKGEFKYAFCVCQFIRSPGKR